MNIRNYIIPALLAGAALLSSSAQAAFTDATLNVQLIIAGTCTVTVGGTLDFGTTPSTLGAPIEAQADLTVNCANGIPYTVELDKGIGLNGTVDLREMRGTSNNTQYVSYTLHRDSSAGPLWGDASLNSTLESGTGDGLNQIYTVYGVIPMQMTPANDTYTDTVTVTVFW